MPASKIRARRQRGPRPRWVRYIGLVLAYGLYWPVIKLMELSGRWPGVLSRGMDRVIGRFGDYQPDAHDVLVCSYFKSGTNWTLQMAVQIAHRGRASFDHIHELVPWAEVPAKFRFSVSLDDDGPHRNSPTQLRIIKTHLPMGKVPCTDAARYICVVRDPKDVFVSSYHFVRNTMLGPLMPSPARWLDTYLSPDTMFGSWAEHVDSCWTIRNRGNVLFLTYEEMKADQRGTIRRIADLMGVDLTDEEFESVVRQSSFSHMKSIGDKFDPTGMAPLWVTGEDTMIRRGERGTSDELLTAGQQRRIDDYWRKELIRLGCDFPYDEAFS